MIPDIHLLAQETLQNAISKEHGFQVEVRTEHRIGDDDVLRDDGYLILVQLNCLSIQCTLHFSLRADGNGIHRHMGGTNLGKLLDAVYNDNIVVGIAYLDAAAPAAHAPRDSRSG